MTNLIQAQDIGKKFSRIQSGRIYTLQERVARGQFRRQRAETFWALRHLTFQVYAGKMVGIIGVNGAGKSTLLRVLGGIILPDEGRLTIHGRISALIDLGAGFHPDLTGKDNLFINAIISGLTRREAHQQYDSILNFAELEQVIENPLRTFSAGMQLRLAFAIAVHIQPEILLVDELLAVGDARFQKKCLQKIEQFRSSGSAIVLVSHNTTLVRQICDEVLWLRQGSIADQGPAADVVDAYLTEINENPDPSS